MSKQVPICFGEFFDEGERSGCLKCRARIYCKQAFEFFVHKKRLGDLVKKVESIQEIIGVEYRNVKESNITSKD